MFNEIIEIYEGKVRELTDMYNDRYAKACEALKRGDQKNYISNVDDMNRIEDTLSEMNRVMAAMA